VYQPPKAVANAKRLVERDKVFIMMGHLAIRENERAAEAMGVNLAQ
jgi:hypothetical protein